MRPGWLSGKHFHMIMAPKWRRQWASCAERRHWTRRRSQDFCYSWCALKQDLLSLGLRFLTCKVWLFSGAWLRSSLPWVGPAWVAVLRGCWLPLSCPHLFFWAHLTWLCLAYTLQIYPTLWVVALLGSSSLMVHLGFLGRCGHFSFLVFYH
jgi:hypothetical protein